MNKNTFSSVGILIGALGAAAYSCSPSVEADPGLGLGATTSTAARGGGAGQGQGGASAGSGSLVTGGTTTGGANGSGATGGGLLDVDASSDASMQIEEDAACGTGEASATLKDINMFVMFDRSWSMNECGDGTTSMTPGMGGTQVLDCAGDSRWDLTSKALTLFFQNEAAAGLNVALRFFPDDNPVAGCDGYTTMGNPGFPMGDAGTPDAATDMPNCDVNACAAPLVDIAPLLTEAAPVDAHEAALVAAVMNGTPAGPEMPNPNPGTPTSAALGGAEQWATAYQTAHPDAQTVVVLITDGEPYGCDTSTNNIAALARTANMAGVLTYVVGLTGSSEQQLNQIADAGGTEEALFVSDGSTATEDLLQALLEIRGTALQCNFAVPTSDSSGKEIDPKLVNVNYQSGANGMVTELGLVGSMADCGTSLGWYFDNPDAPTQIFLCPEACTIVTNDNMANLQVLAGCKPHIITK